MNPELRKYFYAKNKYRAKRTKCPLGHYHPSKFEAEYCIDLSALRRAKEIYEFHYQRRMEIRVNGILITNHYPDFTVWKTREDFENDIFEIHETKGFETDLWNIKYKLFQAVYPQVRYVVIKRK